VNEARPGGELAAATVVGGTVAGGQRLLPARLELLGGAVAAIRVTGRHQLLGARPIQVVARALEERALVPVETHPAEAVDDRLDRLGRRALAVRVLDAEHERAAAAAGEQPVEQRRARVAHMELAGRAGSEADAHPVFT